MGGTQCPPAPFCTHRAQQAAFRCRRNQTVSSSVSARVRTLLLKEGTAVAPGSQTPEHVDEWISDLVATHRPTLRGESAALFARIPDRDLEIAISNHGGAIMAAYGDAGYFVGLSVGLELAALTFAGARLAERRHVMKKSTPASSPQPAAPSQPSVPVPAEARDLTRKLEDLGSATTPKLALLIRWSQAESLVD